MSKKQKQYSEIFWNIVNSLLVGAISFFSGLAAVGELSLKVFGIGLITAVLVAITQFKKFWDGEEKDIKKGLFILIQ